MNELALLMGASGGAPQPLYSDDVFSTYLYTGNGSTQTINNGIDLAGKGGMVWCKQRSSTENHFLFDTDRGINKYLQSTNTSGQTTVTNTLPAFNSTGFDVGSNGPNTSSTTYVSWTFRKAPKFFDCGTYTGNGVAGRQISHALGVAPGMVIVKRTDSTGAWPVYHRGLADNELLYLNTTGAVANTDAWNWVDPTASVFYLGTDGNVNNNGASYVWYAFAHDTSTDGIIQCGSFTTDGSGNATVNLGWEPQFAILKASSAAESWRVLDAMRGWVVGGNDAQLQPNTSNAEDTTAERGHPTSTGFDARSLANSTTYIYLAIRRPNKPPTTGTQVFSIATADGSTSPFKANHIVDMAMWTDRLSGSAVDTSVISNRLAAGAYANCNSSAAETTYGGYSYGYQNGFMNNIFGGAASRYISYMFKRAPGVFDVVCYTGTGATLTVNHSLGVAPEFWIIKARNSVTSGLWFCEHEPTSSGLRLNQDMSSLGDYGLSWSATSITFAAGSFNGSGSTHVMYLFATKAGISKVGSYTGNGSSLNIDMGFSTGARFFMCKRTDSTGDWYVWDSVRGIVAGNDPHLSLNTTASEVTTNDSIDPYAQGLTVNQVAATNINVSSATYIYLAFA